jgi:hypothetical protein
VQEGKSCLFHTLTAALQQSGLFMLNFSRFEQICLLAWQSGKAVKAKNRNLQFDGQHHLT